VYLSQDQTFKTSFKCRSLPVTNTPPHTTKTKTQTTIHNITLVLRSALQIQTYAQETPQNNETKLNFIVM